MDTKITTLPLGVSPREANMAIALGLLGATAFPPLGLFPCSLLATALLLVLLRNKDTQTARNLGIVFGGVYALSTMYWFFNLFGVQAVPLMALMAGYFGLLATLIGMTRNVKPWRRAALVAMFAVSVEWLRGDAWYLRFPWYTPPHALAQSPDWIALARWLGVYGLSYLIWFIAAAGAFRHAMIWVLFFLLPATSYLLPTFDAPDRKALLLQAESQSNVEAQIAAAPQEKVDLAVLPELAFLCSPEMALKLPRGPVALATKTQSPIVFGAIDGEYGGQKFRNLAAVIDAQGKLLGAFQKQRPVPLMGDGIAGTERPVFAIDQGTLGVAICYDLDAPAVAQSLLQYGATVLVVPIFDGISWSHNQHVNHELLLRLRAVEADRWILRSASSGRSEVIDPHGRPSVGGIEIGQVGSIVLPYSHRNTFALGGRVAMLGPLAAIGTVLFVLWRTSPLYRKRASDATNTEVNRDSLFRGLRESLKLLASDGSTALASVPDGCCKPDELALDFDNWRAAVIGNFGSEMPPDLVEGLNAIDRALAALKKTAWTEEAVCSHLEWAAIREQAKVVLVLLIRFESKSSGRG